jgi:predicted permease
MRWSQWMPWTWRRSDDDFAAEIESHLYLEVERLVRSGMRPNDARLEARRAFGNPTAVREHFHEGRPWSGLETLTQDVRHGLRAMRRTPGFTTVAVASLAIGIGANTTMFGAIDSLLIRAPAHVRDATRIHRVYFDVPSPGAQVATHESYRTYSTIRDHVPGLEAVGAFAPKTVSSGRGPDARPIDAVLVTPSMFTLLGVRPAMGRFFVASEERDQSDHVAVLGYEAWLATYQGDSAVLGRAIDVAGTPYVIVGIAPSGFTGIDLDRVDLWLPLGAATKLVGPGVMNPQGGGYWLQIAVKRRADVRVPQVTNEITKVYRDTWRDSPMYEKTFSRSRGILAPIVAARGPVPNADARAALWVGTVSLLVLLIASANVANLLLLRGLTRSREVALRLSLGATRWRVVRQWLVEGALLSIAGAVCAIVLARWSASSMRAFLLPKAAGESVVQPRLLAFTVLAAFVAGILASLVPALVAARRDFGPLLSAGRVGGGQTRLTLQRVLIGGQVALATLLLVGAGLFVRSLQNVRAIDLGVDVEHVLYVNLDFGSARKLAHDSIARASVNATYAAMLERVRRISGVANATVTVGEPLESAWMISLQRRGGPALVRGDRVPFARAVGTNYFETMGTPLKRGRFFRAADFVPGAHVAIVDEAAAKQFLPDGNGLDPCVYLGSDKMCTEIVGVVANTVRWDMTGDKGAVVYLTLEEWPDAVTMMEVRTIGNPTSLIPAVRQAVLSVSPDLPWADIRPISERLDPQLRPWRLGASMFTAFGVLALCLAAVGLYGLLSYIVVQRTHEIGVRKALGASDGGVIRMVLRGALGMTLAGIAVGVVIALGAGRLVASQLYGISPHDPAVIALCAGALVIVAIVASLVPARRATHVDPMVALRAE